MLKSLHVKRISKIFHDIESAKDEMFEADPSLEKGMTICQA
jgi:hypothetical protein